MSQYFIGLSTSGHDPAFAVVNEQGRAVFAEATERYLQDKRAWGVAPDHLGHISGVINSIIADDPDARFHLATSWKSIKAELPIDVSDTLLPASLGRWIMSLQAQVQSNAGIHCRYLCRDRLVGEILKFDHHHCHAANALYSAPFDNGLCLVLDGEGEVGAATLYTLRAGQLKRDWRSWGPGSLGTFYGWLTELCGFSTVAGEEWKVMGLAAYGTAQDDLVTRLSQLIEVDAGRLRFAELDLVRQIGNEMLSHARTSAAPILQAADLAASGQLAYRRYVDQVLYAIAQAHPNYHNLILTGGCALNSSYNGTILSSHEFQSVHVPSAPADDGNALGAALLAWAKVTGAARLPHAQTTPFLGSSIAAQDIQTIAACSPLQVTRLFDDDCHFIANRLSQQKIIGVMRGAAEYGPRALGNRSILADPRDPGMQDRINRLVKGRESYRPFAPVVPLRQLDEWFDNPQPSPYMSFTLKWRADQQDRVPAVVHQDGTARLQSVCGASYPWLNALCEAFDELTGVPVILNTSFNVMGKPITHTVNDAMAVLMGTGLDALLLEDIYIEKV